LKQYSESQKDIKGVHSLMDQWSARPEGEIARRPEVAAAGTPEDTLREFLYWRQPKPNYGKMAMLIEREDEPVSSMAGRLRTNVPQPPDRVEVIALTDQVPTAAWLECDAFWGGHKESLRLRMLFTDGSRALPSNGSRGRWRFLNLWPWEAEGCGYRAAQQSRDE